MRLGRPPKGTIKPKTPMKARVQRKRAKIAALEGRITGFFSMPKSVYSEVIAELICTRLANGETLKSVCKDEGYPTPATVIDWINNPNEVARPGFAEFYRRCQENGYHLMASEMVQIADDSAGDKKIKVLPNGQKIEYIDRENIARDKLRVDTRFRVLSKVLPKIYGENIKVEVTGSIDLVGRLEAARRRISAGTENSTRVVEIKAETV